MSAIAKVLFIFSCLASALAFQTGSLRTADISSSRKTADGLYAWSLPIDTKTAFGTWYTELNPTSRQTIYEDPPFEYNYVPLHDDWMSNKHLAIETIQSPSKQSTDVSSSSSPSSNRNPIRVAFNLAQRIRIRHNGK